MAVNALDVQAKGSKTSTRKQDGKADMVVDFTPPVKSGEVTSVRSDDEADADADAVSDGTAAFVLGTFGSQL